MKSSSHYEACLVVTVIFAEVRAQLLFSLYAVGSRIFIFDIFQWGSRAASDKSSTLGHVDF